MVLGRRSALLLVLCFASSTACALPTVWPALDTDWWPLQTGSGVYGDLLTTPGNPYGDVFNTTPSPTSTDLVGGYEIPPSGGNGPFAVGFWYRDATHIMFRMRVNASPTNNTQQVWQVLLNTAPLTSDAEWVLQIDTKTDNQVEFSQVLSGGPSNHWSLSISTTATNVVQGLPANQLLTPSDHHRVTTVPGPLNPPYTGSNFEGNADAFLDLSIGISDFNNWTGLSTGGTLDFGLGVTAFSTSANHNNTNKDVPDFAMWPTPSQGGDWGDLPAPYPTLAGPENGPEHLDGTYEWLGTLWDGEMTGTHSPRADHDDVCFCGIDDEDGVIFDFINSQYEVTVSVLDRLSGRYDTDQLYLSGFIDITADGDFLDVGETVAIALDPTTWSSNQQTVYIPFTPPLGVYSRWRLSYASGFLSPTGMTPYGEVEDYFHPTPEPATLSLLALGILGILARRRRKR